MATSGSTDFSLNRNEICTAALRKTGRFQAGTTPANEDMADTVQALNVLVKSWMGQEIGLWLNQEFVLFLTDGTQKYTLGPSGSRAIPSKHITTTALSTAGVATDLTLEVDSTSGMTAGDKIGILLDDNTIDWDVIDSVTDADTVVITTGLTGAAAVDNAIYSYTGTNIISRPTELIEMRCRIAGTTERDVPVDLISRDEYMALANKSTTGSTITQVYFDNQIVNADLYVWPTINTEANRLVGTTRRLVEDFDSVNNDMDFPPEWTRALIWNVADEVKIEYGVDLVTSKEIERKADKFFKEMKFFDRENTSVFIELDDNE